MVKANHSQVTEFLLLGFHDLHVFRIPAFLLLLVIYLLTVAGNFLIIILVTISHLLQSPMYIFLLHLSACDILISTNVSPNTLKAILNNASSISIGDCGIQLYFFGASASIECCLLSVMSYDRYLAICNPLQYASIMNLRLPYYLVTWCWTAGFFMSLIPYILLLQLEFCGPNIIDHFFCDLPPLLELSCSDSTILENIISTVSTLVGLLQCLFVLVTYICIFTNIFQITSASGRQKAFYTCSSHLCVVCTYYGSLVSLNIAPTGGYSLNLKKGFSLLNTVLTPLLNPLIYSIRNKEIRAVIYKLYYK